MTQRLKIGKGHWNPNSKKGKTIKDNLTSIAKPRSAAVSDKSALMSVNRKKIGSDQKYLFLIPVKNVSLLKLKYPVMVHATTIHESNKELKGKQKQNKTGKK